MERSRAPITTACSVSCVAPAHTTACERPAYRSTTSASPFHSACQNPVRHAGTIARTPSPASARFRHHRRCRSRTASASRHSAAARSPAGGYLSLTHWIAAALDARITLRIATSPSTPNPAKTARLTARASRRTAASASRLAGPAAQASPAHGRKQRRKTRKLQPSARRATSCSTSSLLTCNASRATLLAIVVTQSTATADLSKSEPEAGSATANVRSRRPSYASHPALPATKS